MHNFFYFSSNDTAPTATYTLSLHDALPICDSRSLRVPWRPFSFTAFTAGSHPPRGERDNGKPGESRGRKAPRLPHALRSEEHTSELQSHHDLVCRLLLEKKKNNIIKYRHKK